MRPTRRMHAPVHASAPVWVYLNLRYVLVSFCVHRCDSPALVYVSLE